MKARMILLCMGILLSAGFMRADETVTVTATSTDISENLDLKTVATLFGQAKDLEQFEQMLNNPDSAFSNLDLNADGEVDYLRVIETADGDRHLVVIQAVLAKDIYQDVASIFVEKDKESNQVTVQVVGDEYIYGANYIIEPVYIYRPYIYDWFWGPSWVCWHSPYYWGYWPAWWHPYHCVDPFIYWDHCYWHHYHHPICSYRTSHHHHPHYAAMHQSVKRDDFAKRHPDRSFVTRNASRNITNARALEQGRRTAVRQATSTRGGSSAMPNTTRISPTSTRGNAQTTRNATFNSSNLRQPTTATRVTTTGATRSSSASRVSTSSSPSRPSTTTTVRTSSVQTNRVSSTPVRSTSTSVRSSSTTPTRSSSTVRSSSTPSRSSSTSTVRSTPAPSRSSGSMPSSGGASRSGGSSSRGGGSTRR